MSQNNTPRPAVHDLEVFDRLTAVRDMLDALLGGRIRPNFDTIDNLAGTLKLASLHQFAADTWGRP